MVSFHVIGLQLKRLVCIIDAPSEVLQTKVSHCAVAVGGCLVWVKFDGAGVRVNCRLVILCLHVLVAYEASVFSAALVLNRGDKILLFICLQTRPF